MSHIKKAIQKAKKSIVKTFIDPSRRVKNYNSKMDAMNKVKAKEGYFNTGEDSANSQSY